MATMIKIRESNLPLPAAAVILSPWVDLRSRGKVVKKYRKFEPELAIGLKIFWMIQNYWQKKQKRQELMLHYKYMKK